MGQKYSVENVEFLTAHGVAVCSGRTSKVCSARDGYEMIYDEERGMVVATRGDVVSMFGAQSVVMTGIKAIRMEIREPKGPAKKKAS